MISQYINNIKKIAQPDKYIVDEIYLMNINRVFYLSLISIAMRLLPIIIFLNKSSTGDEKEAIWRIGIIISHITYFVLLIILNILSYKLRKIDKPNFMTIVTQYTAIASILLFGVLITSIDQLVTPSITPFIIACISIGAIFIIKPLHSLPIFSSAYIIYYFAMGITQPELSLLLSNRINGFTSIIFGIFLSLVLWGSNVVNLEQRNYIICQQKGLEEQNRELLYLATFDSLTGLINRRYFEEKASHEILRIKRYGEKLCLLLLDIDNFKGINDKYGHPVGDRVLQSFASILKQQLRVTDIVSRIGGEEFAILLINADAKVGRIVAEKIRSIIEKEDFAIDGHEINITVSIGITAIDNRIASYEEAYRYADRALYSAKAKGKNSIDINLG